MLFKKAFRQIKTIVPIFEVTAISASNQPTNDDVQVLSNNAGDTQTITLFGIDNSNVFQVRTLTLTGTTAVDSVLDPKWKTIYGAFLGDTRGNISKRAVGIITIREKSGGQAIATIAAGKLSTGALFFDIKGQDVTIENIDGNTYFNPDGLASTTGACGQMTGRMSRDIVAGDYLSLISDATGSTVQMYVY